MTVELDRRHGVVAPDVDGEVQGAIEVEMPQVGLLNLDLEAAVKANLELSNTGGPPSGRVAKLRSPPPAPQTQLTGGNFPDLSAEPDGHGVARLDEF